MKIVLGVDEIKMACQTFIERTYEVAIDQNSGFFEDETEKEDGHTELEYHVEVIEP